MKARATTEKSKSRAQCSRAPSNDRLLAAAGGVGGGDVAGATSTSITLLVFSNYFRIAPRYPASCCPFGDCERTDNRRTAHGTYRPSIWTCLKTLPFQARGRCLGICFLYAANPGSCHRSIRPLERTRPLISARIGID